MDGVDVENTITRDRIRAALSRYENKPVDRFENGTVRAVNADGSYEVLLDGDVQPRTCSAYATAGVGDRVLVCIMANGRCVAVARLEGTYAEFAKPVVSTFQPTTTGEHAFAIENETAGTDTYYAAKRVDTDTQIMFGVGKGGINHGVYSEVLEGWLIYNDGDLYSKMSRLNLTAVTDASVTSDKNVALIVGNRSGDHMVLDTNEIIAKNSPTTAGNIFLVGDDAYLTSVAAGEVDLRPYYRAGDTITIDDFKTAGYLTSSKTQVHFAIPLDRPIIGNPTVTVRGTDGFILRQSGYTHGSAASTWIHPSAYKVASIKSGCINVYATFSDTTNAENNAPIGINWYGAVELT